MSNDNVQSIMALVTKYSELCGNGVTAQNVMDADKVWREIESAIREAIAAPGVATDEKTIALAMLAVDDPLQWGRLGPDSKKMIVQFVRALAAPSPTTEQPVTIKGGNE